MNVSALDTRTTQPELVKEELLSLYEYCNKNQHNESQKLITTLLMNAVGKRFQSGQVHEHIYLKNDGVAQIQLFNMLIEKFPLVKYSQCIVNNAIIDTIGGETSATIIDIGIGQGVQMLQVIECAKQLPGLQRLHIIGIEPFAEAIQIAEANINACKNTVHFDIEFTGYNRFAEEFDFSQIKQTDNLIVNASLSLHHIQAAGKRADVISQIKKLNPKAFILIEPNVNHFEKNFSDRFKNCYNHYYNLFRVIDEIDIAPNDKKMLKLFFGREIDDVIGKDEEHRYEKHELATSWINRIADAGFSLSPQMLQSPVQSESGVSIKHHPEGFLGFTYDQETLLAVMYAL